MENRVLGRSGLHVTEISLTNLGTLELDPKQIHLWSAPLDLPEGLVADLSRLLCPTEQEKVARFIFEHDRRRSIVSRGILRILLGRYSAVPASQLQFEYTAQGKPSLCGLPLHFNVAHSHEQLLIAVTAERPVGVDIEWKAPLPDWDRLATRFFSSAETTALQRLEASQQLDGFYNCWTRKEAYLKATGTGLSAPLKGFTVSVEPADSKSARMLEIGGNVDAAAEWRIYDVAPAPGYAGAVAVQADSLTVRCRELIVDDIGSFAP